MMIFEDHLFLTTYAVSSKEDTSYQRLDFTRKRVRSKPNTAYPADYIRRIQLVNNQRSCSKWGVVRWLLLPPKPPPYGGVRSVLLPPQPHHGGAGSWGFSFGAVRRQTTIVVVVGRRYSHHSRTLWCRDVMAQPLEKHWGGQPPKTTTVVAAEPTTATTAAPCGVVM
nr:hypothetical protein [Tanacetum cinerariifolium]